jgi:hypothetical protein
MTDREKRLAEATKAHREAINAFAKAILAIEERAKEEKRLAFEPVKAANERISEIMSEEKHNA